MKGKLSEDYKNSHFLEVKERTTSDPTTILLG